MGCLKRRVQFSVIHIINFNSPQWQRLHKSNLIQWKQPICNKILSLGTCTNVRYSSFYFQFGGCNPSLSEHTCMQLYTVSVCGQKSSSVIPWVRVLGYFLFVCRGETMPWSCSHEVWSAERKKETVFPPVSGIFIFSTSLWSQGTICVTDSCSIMTAQFLHTDTTLYRTVNSAGILVNFLLQVFVYDY